MKVLIAATAIAALTGCTTWSQPGKTELDFNRDMYGCQRDVVASNDAVYMAYLRNRCMETKGWRQSW